MRTACIACIFNARSRVSVMSGVRLTLARMVLGYNGAADRLQREKAPIKFASVDCTTAHELCSHFDIKVGCCEVCDAVSQPWQRRRHVFWMRCQWNISAVVHMVWMTGCKSNEAWSKGE